MRPTPKNLQLIKGALFDEGEVAAAIKGSDAVLSAPWAAALMVLDKTRDTGYKKYHCPDEKKQCRKNYCYRWLWGILNADENSLIMDAESFPKEYIPC
ncbi:MAG: hypothetical protein WDM90_20860 [Ferruginibacter sp.]